MRKVMVFILAFTMLFGLCACGASASADKQSQGNVENGNTVEGEIAPSETEEIPEVVDPLVAEEEIVGVWIDAEGHTFEFTEDNGLRYDEFIELAEIEYNPWTIEGDVLSFESYGDTYKWEIQIENEQITLKFVDEGCDYALALACRDLVKQP